MPSNHLILKQLELGPMMNLIYVVGCGETREAAVVDPGWDAPAILDAVRQLGLRLSHLWITHAHPDHINGLEELLEATSAQVFLNAEELAYMRQMAETFHVDIGFLERHAGRLRPVTDNEEILLGKNPVRCLHTPGHTPGSQCFLVEKNLFSGDTLFIDACGRVDLPGGDPEKMWWSLNRKLRTLDDDVTLYPGHSYGDRLKSTMGEQKRSNPYMQFDSAAQFLRAMGIR